MNVLFMLNALIIPGHINKTSGMRLQLENQTV